MAAVLVGRKAPLIIDALIQATEPTKEGQLDAPALSLLAQCIADEVQMPPETVERTVKSLGKAYFEKGVPRGDLLGDDLLRGILASKYRDSFSDALARGLFRSQSEFWMYGSMLAGMATRRYLWDADDRLQKAWLGKLEVLLGTDATPRQHAEGALSVMIVAFHSRERRRAMGRGGELTVDALHKVEQLVRPLLSKNNHIAVRRATIWAYSWLGQYPLDARKCARQILPSLYEQWKTAKLALDRRHAAWSFSNQPLLPRSSRPLGELTAEDEDFIEREWQAHTVGQWNREDRQPAAVLAAYYFGGPFSNADLRKKIGELNTGVLELRLRKRRL
jgi:hypothetical protein